MPPILAYWRTRTVAQPIRLLLRYAGVNFEDLYYPRGPGPEFHKKSFRDIKDKLDIHFPNLPYYIDGDLRLSQANAILRHLARKHNLYGATEVERVRVDQVMEAVIEIKQEFYNVCYNNAEEKDNYVAKANAVIKGMQDFLGDRPFFAGESLTFVDFVVYEFLDQNKTLIPETLEGVDKLHAFMTRIEALPSIKSYMESDQFVKSPIHSLTAGINTKANSDLFMKGGSVLVKGSITPAVDTLSVCVPRDPLFKPLHTSPKISTPVAAMPPILAYWRYRTLAQPIRLLLRYAGVDFEDMYYPRGPGPEFHKQSFRDIKDTLDIHFPNLPYYIDGDLRLSQANAILRHLARKHDLYGATEVERVRVDQVMEALIEIKEEFYNVCYHYPEEKHNYVAKANAVIKGMQAFLGDRPFFAGESLTFVDFVVYEFLDQNKTLIPETMEGVDKLHAFMTRVEALPSIKSYMESDQFVRSPIHSLVAAINTTANSDLFMKGGSVLVKGCSK